MMSLTKCSVHNVWLVAKIIQQYTNGELYKKGQIMKLGRPKPFVPISPYLAKFTSSCLNQLSVPCTQSAYKNQHITYKCTLKCTRVPYLQNQEIRSLE